MLSRDALALKQMLEDVDFRRPVLEELASGKDHPLVNCVILVTTMLIRKSIPRDRAELYANAYVMGIMLGLGIVGMKDEKSRR